MKNLPLAMVRPNLKEVPQFGLPQGFSIRWHRTGDAEVWLGIHLLADQYNRISASLFEAQFGRDETLLSHRQCYLLNERGSAIGTATAWFNDNFQGERFGRVHWVAIIPEYQKRGLGKSLMSVICNRLAELGHERAYLSTSSARLTAIKLYLRFGFSPLMRNDAEEEIWRELRNAL